jgi:hypothetical protein
MSRSFAQVSLLALTVGFAAFGSSPAAARTSVHPGNIRLPSAQTGPGASMHPISEKIHLPQVVTAPGASKYPVGAKIHVVSGVQNAPGAGIYPGGGAKTVPGVQTAPGASIYPGGGGAKTVPNVQTVPGISIYPGKLKTPDPIPNIGGGVDNVCPFNKFKCPPKPPAGPGSAGNPTPGPGPAGPVVVVAPTPVYQAPVPVYQAPVPVVTATNAPTAPVYQAPRPNVATTSAAPCNCLTKQYLDDGSVLFQDLCTKETALATPDQLPAQVPTVAPTVR